MCSNTLHKLLYIIFVFEDIYNYLKKNQFLDFEISFNKTNIYYIVRLKD